MNLYVHTHEYHPSEEEEKSTAVSCDESRARRKLDAAPHIP